MRQSTVKVLVMLWMLDAMPYEEELRVIIAGSEVFTLNREQPRKSLAIKAIDILIIDTRQVMTVRLFVFGESKAGRCVRAGVSRDLGRYRYTGCASASRKMSYLLYCMSLC